jgi:hypothetical protein
MVMVGTAVAIVAGEVVAISVVSDTQVGTAEKFDILKERIFMFGVAAHGFTPTMKVN